MERRGGRGGGTGEDPPGGKRVRSRPRTAPLRPSPHRGFRFGPKRFGSRRTERGGEVGRPPRPLPQPRRSRSLHFRVWVEPLPLPVPALLPVPPSLPLPVPPSLPRGRAANPARGVGEVGVVVGGGIRAGVCSRPPPEYGPPPHGTGRPIAGGDRTQTLRLYGNQSAAATTARTGGGAPQTGIPALSAAPPPTDDHRHDHRPPPPPPRVSKRSRVARPRVAPPPPTARGAVGHRHLTGGGDKGRGGQ